MNTAVELRRRYAIRNQIEAYPITAATIVPMINGVKLSEGNLSQASRNSNSPLAAIAGIERRNENRAAVSRV